eukprot:543781-Rhodomonas_salina.3
MRVILARSIAYELRPLLPLLSSKTVNVETCVFETPSRRTCCTNATRSLHLHLCTCAAQSA